MRPPEVVRAGALCVGAARASGCRRRESARLQRLAKPRAYEGVHACKELIRARSGRKREFAVDAVHGFGATRAASAPAAAVAVAWLSTSLLRSPRLARAQDISCDRPGAKEVRALTFEGNDTFSDDELSARVVTTPSSFTHRYFRWFFNAGTARCLPEDGLGPDVELLKTFYKNNGFYETKVDTIVTPLPPDRVDVTFRIDEGPPLRAELVHDHRARFGSGFGGHRARSADRQGRARRLAAGLQRDRHDHRATAERRAIRTRRSFRAFTANAAKRTASVELQVETGARARIGTIAIARGGSTPERPPEIDSAVVLGLLGFRSGDWYSDRALTDARRNLYNLGAYRHVGIDPRHGAAGDRHAHRDRQVDVREDFLRQLQLEEGWAQLDCFRVDALYTDKNFLGSRAAAGRDGPRRRSSASARRRIGDRCATAAYLHAGQHRQLEAELLRRARPFDSRRCSADTGCRRTRRTPSDAASTSRISERRTSVSMCRRRATSRRRRRSASGTRWSSGRRTRSRRSLCACSAGAPRRTQAAIQGACRSRWRSASLQQARVDNPVEPRSGYIVGGGDSRRVDASSARIRRCSSSRSPADGSLYRPVTSRVTFAIRLRGGVIGGTAMPPPQERLYAGGATSVRGFQQNELGPLVYLVDSSSRRLSCALPNGDRRRGAGHDGLDATCSRTIPTGGNRLVVLNTELRIRDPFFPDLLEYVPFVDAGEVFTSEVSDQDQPRSARRHAGIRACDTSRRSGPSR